MATSVIFDCDPGHDDAVALIMAHHSVDIDLLAVTTVCGNAGIERTTANARRVLKLIEASTPVYSGCAAPLARDLVLGTADGPSGLDGSPYLPEPGEVDECEHAVSYLERVLESTLSPITIVATGPLTNIAMLLLKAPHLTRKIEKLIVMGGAFWRRDTTITPTEFNIFCDPEAAQIVLNSGADITMVGLDVTMKVLVEKAEFDALAKIELPLARVVEDWLRFYEKLHRGQMGIGGALHDPLALAFVIDPTLVTTCEAHVEVELEGVHTFGATVADFWGLNGKAPNVKVCSTVDSDRFFSLLWRLMAPQASVSST